MKSLIIGVLFFSLSALAHNPQIHICNVTEGKFQALQLGSDQVGFCQYGSAFVDAVSLMKVTSNESTTLAIRALEAGPASSCEEVSAMDFGASNLEGTPYEICKFEDDSYVELSTLQNGLSANAKLSKAVSTRF
jgi:hypothetical protein